MARNVPSGGRSKNKRFVQWALQQNNTRGMGLARDVRAGQANPVPRSYSKRAKRRRD